MDTSPATAHPSLDAAAEVDVAVVGGGIAGLSTAWELARAGHRVAILEADRIAAGVTGYTTAKVSVLHTLVYDRLHRTRGLDAARSYARSQQGALDRLREIVAELDIDCDLEQCSSFTYVAQPGDATGEKTLRAEAKAAAEAGLRATYVEETGLPFAVGGAVCVADQAQFHPRKYLLALAEDFGRLGGVIYERTRVTDLSEGSPCQVTTEAGHTVTAQHVVVATHYPIFDRALLFSRLTPSRELVVAAPLPAGDDPGGMYITEDEGKRSVRTAPYGDDDSQRLLIVTGEGFTPGTGDPTESFARLDAWLHERFPTAGPTAYRWAAQDNSSTDTVPLIGPLHKGSRNTYVAAGFGGWGMTNGILAGQLITAQIAGESPAWADLYDPRRLKSVAKEASGFLSAQAKVAKHFVGDRLSTGHVDSVAEIAPGTGAVVRVDGERCAVYRDPDGTTHAVSARCTHLGCLVAFNEAETSWDCPCHGSRFDVEGAVLQGPAVRPLERVGEFPDRDTKGTDTGGGATPS
ncbi:FAD-dependent oxidoreductase [Streptomyces sp. NPDC051214]|uniref:FAD-dependent oxidoreductase n=1 Tax=Streptomyces sp. NPDC051214 TaxID=3155282 RepID=UPI003447C7F0